MIQRFIGFWQSLNHFFVWFNDLLGEVHAFVPVHIRLALGAFSTVALVLLIVKFIKMLTDVLTSFVRGVFVLFGITM